MPHHDGLEAGDTAAVTLLLPIVALGVPIADSTLALVRRLVRGQDVFRGDARHIHHRLLDAGLSPEGTQMYRIGFGRDLPGRDVTVSEGQGYGMIIVSHMAGYDPDAQTIFDGLWEFVRAHPSEADPRLMDWYYPDADNGNVSAFDGDADIAYGLLLADAQWGSSGRINYRAAADTMMLAILESTIGSECHLPMLGDWVEQYGDVHSQYTPQSGVPPEEAPGLIDAASRLPGLEVAGLMAIPPPSAVPEGSRRWFALLRALRERWDGACCPRGTLRELSMGMSDD